MYKDLFEDLTLSPLPFIREGGFQLWYFTEIWVPLLLAICHAQKMFNFSFRWPTNHFVTHYFITFIVQNLNALINVTKGLLIYEQYQHFLFVLVSTVAYMVLNIQLLKNSHALSSTYPILLCFRFCVQQLPYILIYLFISFISL